MKKYKNSLEIKKDGWVLWSSIFPTEHVYYIKNGTIKTLKDLLYV